MKGSDFAKLSQWVDCLPQKEYRDLFSLYRKAKEEIRPVLPESHGAGMTSRHRAGAALFEKCRDPFCLVRVGATECSFLGAGVFPSYRWYFKINHFDRDAIRLRPDMAEAFLNAELLGVHPEWEAVARDTSIAFQMLEAKFPLWNAVEVHLPYQLLVDGSLFRKLSGKRVLLVGGLSAELQAAWRSPKFFPGLSKFGPFREVNIVGAVPTAPISKGGSHRDYPGILSSIMKVNFDVALLACGITAKPLAWRIRKEGRTALDVGFVFDAILGNPERLQRPVFKDVDWSASPPW